MSGTKEKFENNFFTKLRLKSVPFFYCFEFFKNSNFKFWDMALVPYIDL